MSWNGLSAVKFYVRLSLSEISILSSVRCTTPIVVKRLHSFDFAAGKKGPGKLFNLLNSHHHVSHSCRCSISFFFSVKSHWLKAPSMSSVLCLLEGTFHPKPTTQKESLWFVNAPMQTQPVMFFIEWKVSDGVCLCQAIIFLFPSCRDDG